MIKRLALGLMLVWVLLLVLGQLHPLSPSDIHLEAILQSPSENYWLGTDDLGRDIFTRITHGALMSILLAMSVTVLTLSIGTSIGIVAGYYGGTLDAVLMRITDVFLAFPGLLLAIAFAAVLGPGLNNLVLALSLTGWVSYARLARGQAASLRTRQHVQAAQSLGASHWRLMRVHIAPLMLSVLIVEATYSLASVMIAEASLSFLGLGIQPPAPSWGSMLRDAVRYMLMAPHYVMSVGLCMMSLILAINFAGDALRDKLDVKTDKT